MNERILSWLNSTIATSLLMTLLSACGGDSAGSVQRAAFVRTEIVQQRDRQTAVTLTGAIQARSSADLSFRVSGRVLARLVDVGPTLMPVMCWRGSIRPSSRLISMRRPRRKRRQNPSCKWLVPISTARKLCSLSVSPPKSYCRVPGLPARVGELAASRRSDGLLAHRCAASDDIAAGASCTSDRRGDGEAASAAAGSAVVGA
jgi:hypothetical protein